MLLGLALLAAPGAGAGGEDWSKLRRPLHLPRVDPGERCPQTPGASKAPLVGFTLGRGPAYPVLGFSAPPTRTQGAVRLRDAVRRDGRYAYKTLWAIAGRYHGPVLIRAARICHGQRRIQFGPGRPRWELRFPAGRGSNPRAPGWRYAPTDTLLLGPGCYAFQIDVRRSSRVGVFRAIP